MANEERGALYQLLAVRGVTRRDFLKWCGATAALMGLSESYVPQIAAAVENAALMPQAPALWINGGACSGCTESMAQADYPDVATVLLDLLSINYFETVMMAQGEDAEAAKADTIAEGGYICIYEGSVMRGFEGNVLRVAGRPQTEELPELFGNAAAIISVGSCAVDGGWVAARPNPGDATGVTQFCADNDIDTPVINLPTCPVNPEWVVAMVVDVLLLGELESGAILDKLDEFGRPRLIFGQTIHDNCPRRGHFENGEFVYEFGSEEEAKGYCLYAVGCKGPQTFTNCPIVRWNRRASWCVESGSPCIGCGTAGPEPGMNWVDQGAPFLNRHRDLPIGDDTTVQPTTVGVIAGAAVGGVLIAHGIGMKAAGRMDGGADYEEMKDYDRKRGGGK